MSVGHSSQDALRILHDELFEVVRSHEAKTNMGRRNYLSYLNFLHHYNKESPIHWTSIMVLALMSLSLVLAYGFQPNRDHWLIFEAFLIIVMLVLNVMFVVVDNIHREQEMLNKARRVIRKIKECSLGAQWTSSQYISLHAPQSQCISLQWTYRDETVVNLPVSLLVEGDVILLRPGQKVPVKCRRLYSDEDEDLEEYNAGDEYRPEAEEVEADAAFVHPQVRTPFKPQAFMVLDTPFIDKLSMVLEGACKRPTSVLNNERYKVYTMWVERRMLPSLVILMIGLNLLRYLMLKEDVGHWTEMFIVLVVHAALPLTTLATPLMWKLIDLFGVAKILVVFSRYRQTEGNVSGCSAASVSSDSLLDLWDSRVSWKEAVDDFRELLRGHPDPLPRTANIIHALGNVTSLCCVDKKGVLSWSNPTGEKVFFLSSKSASKDACKSNETVDAIPEVDEDTETKTSPALKSTKQELDFVRETGFEVLDLTQDAKNGFSLQFDDHEWSKFLPSLKPLGLNILLNTCNKENLERYTEFADHVTCASLSREESVPVMNRRCFCELAREIGFSEDALSIFQPEQILSMYRHLAPLPASKKLKLGIKYKMPMPNVFSLIAKDTQSGLYQMMSQGTGDFLLDACTDFWDGMDLQPMTDGERRKIADFYHRTSMSSYCTAFAYRPLSQAIRNELSNMILEVPENRDELYHSLHSPTPSKSWDIQSLDSRLQHKSILHCSVDSLRAGTSSDTIHDADSYFRAECNQIFIGMITMQYQAKQDIVQLIEDLEAACIRFVHFSKENELRSRVFSEKMGLEAGWNCHISLLSDSSESKPENAPVIPALENDATAKARRYSLQQTAKVIKRHSEPPTSKGRRRSAPSALNVEGTQVKFESQPSGAESETVTSDNVIASSSEQMESEVYQSKDEAMNQDETANLLLNRKCNSTPLGNHTKESDTTSQGSHQSEFDTDGNDDDRLLKKRDTVGKGAGDSADVRVEAMEKPSGDDEEDEDSESYPASSHYTENTDSVTGGFGLANRAKLPKGIENIRPHIDNVDNVPLLVSLFTDCTPQTTRDMLGILQEYGEVVCCFGSSAAIDNCDTFLQADCGLAVEPHYPQVCVRHGVVEESKKEELSTPMGLSATLNSIPCSFAFDREDRISVIHLIAQAREHCQAIRNAFLLLLMFQLTLCLLQLLDAVLLLPPILNTHHIIWLDLFTLPLMTVSMMGSPRDNSIMKKALGKNKKHLTKQAMIEFVVYYMVSFVPTLAVCLLCHGLTLSSYCASLTPTGSNSTCHNLYGDRGNDDTGTWNGWTSVYSSALTFSQNFAACQLVIYFACTSLCYIHRLDHLWRKSPLLNRLWCIITPVLLILQIMYFILDVTIHNNQRGDHMVFSATHSPVVCWLLAFLWPFVLIPILELIKRREIRLAVRYQRRARLDFGTKLGMNSPF